MQRPLVGVVVASRSDFNMMRRGLETLRIMGVPYLFEVISPQRNPEKLGDFARSAGERGIEVLIAAEGGAALLAARLAAHTTLPIVGVPIDASPLRGQDALFSMVMVPTGLPIATVGINNSENAAILATQILALKHARFRTVLAHRRMAAHQRAEALQKDLAGEYPDLCRADRTAPLSYAVADEVAARETPSEAITPDVPDDNERIRPGAIWVDRSTAEELVSTPEPQEPGFARPPTPQPPPASLNSLLGDPWRARVAEIETLGDEETPSPDRFARLAASEPETHALPEEPSKREPTPRPVPAAEPTPRPGAVQPAVAIETKIFKVDRHHLVDDLIDHAMMVLLEGGVVAMPTDTVYGLAADATNEDAARRLYNLGTKEVQKTLGVLIHHPDMLNMLVSEVPAELEKVIERFWPGALTIVLSRRKDTLPNVAKTDRIGVRIPSDPVCLAVMERLGRPLLVRSASLQGAEPIAEAGPVIERFSGQVDCILDGGPCQGSAGASTVLNATGAKFELMREGAITRVQLMELLGPKLKEG